MSTLHYIIFFQTHYIFNDFCFCFCGFYGISGLSPLKKWMRLWWKLHGYEVLLGSPVESYPKNNISMLDHQTDNGLNPTSEIFQHTNLSTDHQSEQKSGGLSYRVANRIWSPTTPERERKSSKKFQEPDSCSFSYISPLHCYSP